jgi:hypothetical protein
MRDSPLLERLACHENGVRLLLAAGAGLRALELLRDRSLRWDEASLALNLLHLPLAGLLGPLEHDQVAPPLFLLFERAFVALLGPRELVLRLQPFLAGVLALFLFARLAREVLGTGTARLLALGAFALTDSLIYYSADAKQYSGDVVAALLLWLAAGRLARAPGPRATATFALASACAPWLSHAALFVAGGTGLVLAARSWRQRDHRGLALRVAPLVLSSTVLYLAVLRFQAGNRVLDQYWASGFAPLLPTSIADLKWLVSAFFGLFTTPFGNGAKLYGLTAFTMIVGLVALARRERTGFYLLLAPLLPLYLASGLHRYPCHGRLLTFLVPVVWLGVGAGVVHLWQLLLERDRWITWLLALMLWGHPLLNVLQLLQSPRHVQEFRPVAEHLRAHRRPGDVLYLSLASQNALRYYAELLGFELEPLQLGTAVDFAGPELHRDLESLRGRGRVWFVFVYVDPSQVEADVAGRVAMARLAELGTELDRLDAYAVRLCLFDLGAPR